MKEFVQLYRRRYWQEEGLVTGGQYGSHQGCQPYKIAHCSHHEPGKYPNCAGMERTPKCEKSCESGYNIAFKDDKHYGKSVYSVRGVEKIQTEIMTNGPVEAAFTVYADFPTYTSGTSTANNDKFNYNCKYIELPGASFISFL